MSESRPYQILCVEDNDADKELIKFLFSECEIKMDVHFVDDGVAGIDFLLKKGQYENLPTPDLIIMDLNMPGKDGRTLIREVKANKNSCKIPVVMLSTSSSEREVGDCYCLGASAFITKPTNVKKFQELIKTMVTFYFECVALPTRLDDR